MADGCGNDYADSAVKEGEVDDGIVRDSGDLLEISRPTGKNDIGMVAWRL